MWGYDGLRAIFLFGNISTAALFDCFRTDCRVFGWLLQLRLAPIYGRSFAAGWVGGLGKGLFRTDLAQSSEGLGMTDCFGDSWRVSRCLFGKPDHDELEKWLTKELEAIQTEREKGYGFDFKNDQPIPSTAYVVEAVPENEVPLFYRTVYYPSKERSKKQCMSQLALAVDCVDQKPEGSSDVVAYHTRSRDAPSAKAVTKVNSIPPLVSKGRVKVASQPRGSTKAQRPSPLKTRNPRKISYKCGFRKTMKQSLLTNYLPVVRKRRSLTRSECSESPKSAHDSPVRTDCLGTKALNSNTTGALFFIIC
uniref:Cyclin-dependent kinase inhibitor domain-containing protein n=1 Tax=Setaria digitata TaxID=48799 RepID=A0A915PNR3_9BILA